MSTPTSPSTFRTDGRARLRGADTNHFVDTIAFNVSARRFHIDVPDGYSFTIREVDGLLAYSALSSSDNYQHMISKEREWQRRLSPNQLAVYHQPAHITHTNVAPRAAQSDPNRT